MQELQGVSVVWVTDTFDGIREALGLYRDDLVRVCALAELGTEPQDYGVHGLGRREAMAWRRHHRTFERLEGTHLCWHLPVSQRLVIAEPDDFSYWRRRLRELPEGRLIGWVSREGMV